MQQIEIPDGVSRTALVEPRRPQKRSRTQGWKRTKAEDLVGLGGKAVGALAAGAGRAFNPGKQTPQDQRVW